MFPYHFLIDRSLRIVQVGGYFICSLVGTVLSKVATKVVFKWSATTTFMPQVGSGLRKSLKGLSLGSEINAFLNVSRETPKGS